MIITSHMEMTLEGKRVCFESQQELCVFRRYSPSLLQAAFLRATSLVREVGEHQKHEDNANLFVCSW